MINSFALGLTLPVMNVIFLEKGLTLSSLALIMALYSALIVLTEIPSGYVSDRFGRRQSFAWAKWASAAGLFITVFTQSLPALIVAVIFLAFARSFSSGSFEAMIIDWHKETYGEERNHEVTSRLSLWETLGLSAGALSSGFVTIACENLPFLSSATLAPFFISALLQILLAVLTALWGPLYESGLLTAREKPRMSEVLGTSLKNRRILSFLILAFSLGFALSSLEKYWQVRVMEITFSSSLASILLGVVVFIGFMAAMLGALSAGGLLKRVQARRDLLLTGFWILMSCSFLLLAGAGKAAVFLILYGLFYFFLEVSSVIQSTLANREIPSHMRASLLSSFSFSLQVGGLVSSLFASRFLAVQAGSIDSLWVITACICLISLVPFVSGVQKKIKMGAISD